MRRLPETVRTSACLKAHRSGTTLHLQGGGRYLLRDRWCVEVEGEGVWTHRTLVDLCVANMAARIMLNAVIVSYALDADSVYDVNYVSTDVLDNTYY